MLTELSPDDAALTDVLGASHRRFERLIADALAQDFSGWDFSYLKGRWHEHPTSWNYQAIIERYLR